MPISNANTTCRIRISGTQCPFTQTSPLVNDPLRVIQCFAGDLQCRDELTRGMLAALPLPPLLELTPDTEPDRHDHDEDRGECEHRTSAPQRRPAFGQCAAVD